MTNSTLQKKSLRIGIVPMTSTDSVEVNLKSSLLKLEFFKDKKTDLICFPENSLFYNFNANLNPADALTLSHPAIETLSQYSVQHNTYLHLGGIPIREEGDKGNVVYNSAVLLSPSGEKKIVYRKIHLFDVDVGGMSWRESAAVSAGREPSVIEICGWKIGMTICYDIRFAELFVHYHRLEVDAIVLPASFTVPTGRAHWATLLKARAIETQAFVLAPAQGGIHHSIKIVSVKPKETWGQSLLFDPWGVELAKTESFDELVDKTTVAESPIWFELDPNLIQKTRDQIPLLRHRKLRF